MSTVTEDEKVAIASDSVDCASDGSAETTDLRPDLPTLDDLVAELNRVKYKRRFRRTIVGVISTLVVVAAIAVLLATRFIPVLQVYGDSMSPTLSEGDVVVAMSYGELDSGDVVAFYHNNKILVKRVIAKAGDWVDVSPDGVVTVNGRILDEPYITDKSLGSSDVDWPYQVPESHIFVMGDHRSTSIDSRNSAVGCIADDDIIGKLVFRVWPFEEIGVI